MRVFVLTSLLILVLTAAAGAAQIHLSVAASLTDATKELIATYQKQDDTVTFRPNFAASGSLAKQIAQGAPADLYISANPNWVTYLVDAGLIPADQVRTFAGNTLVFVGQKGLSVSSLADVATLQRIAIGSPKSVPAGQYAEQALQAAGLYAQLQGKMVMAQDVRQALVYAERGEVDGAFVYKTDALLAQQAVILFEVPQALYSAVTYPVGLTVAGTKNPAAVAFFDYLKTDVASDILLRFGFVLQ